MKNFKRLALAGFLCFAGISVSADDKPNILLILADDIGYSDIGCFGGDADTPVLDRLAAEGIRFTQFYNAARCCPSRASLLTGLYPHQAGVGHMMEKWNVPGYQGHLNDQCVTIAEVLKRVGYYTVQLGKWHVGGTKSGVVPWVRGFDHSWLREGKADYFNSTVYLLDGKPWVCPDPDSFYCTEEMDRQAIGFMRDAVKEKKPFFIYAAYTAAHWPLQAKPEDIKKYRGQFLTRGWDEMRKERYRKQVESGLIPAQWELPDRDSAVPPWDSIKNKKAWDIKMAVYCAQIDSMDRSIGRMMNELERLNIADNTLVLYLQDNGGCPEWIGRKEKQEPGGPKTHQSYRMPWANVSNTPFQQYKHFVGEGGISTPLIAHWPNGIKKPGSIYAGPGHLVDIMATCVDVAGAVYPERYNQQSVTPMEGHSLRPVFETGARPAPEFIFWEHEGNRAVRKGRWKLLSRYEHDVNFYRSWGFPKAPRESEWELYDMQTDRTEMHNVAADHPELVRELTNAYHEWAVRAGVLPYDQVRTLNRKKKSPVEED